MAHVSVASVDRSGEPAARALGHASDGHAVDDDPVELDDDDGDDLGDLFGLGVDDMRINTDPSTAENLAGKFQQNTMIRG